MPRFYPAFPGAIAPPWRARVRDSHSGYVDSMNHLILGLGGTGARVWQALHRRLSSRLEPASGSFRTAVDAVILDTDARNLRDDLPPHY